MYTRAISRPHFVLALLAAASAGPGFTGLLPGPDAELCRALPVAAIEEVLGAQAGKLGGRDLDDFQSCTASFGDAAVKVEHHTPGQPGLPTDVESGLRALVAAFGASIRDVETRDFGGIGCYRGVLEVLGQSMQTAACFQPAGYYTFGVSRPGAPIPMDTVKELLEKMIAQRK